MAESLTVGFLTVLERLGPVERVVFLLADVFGYPFDEIADVVDKSPEACRQIASRARRRVQEDRPKFEPTDQDAWDVAAAFLVAAEAGDLDGLLEMLSEGAVLVSDGGADHHAARRPIVRERIPRFISNIVQRREARLGPDVEVVPEEINGQPGMVVRAAGRPVYAATLAIADGKVDRIWIMVNPDKLARLDAPPVRPEPPWSRPDERVEAGGGGAGGGTLRGPPRLEVDPTRSVDLRSGRGREAASITSKPPRGRLREHLGGEPLVRDDDYTSSMRAIGALSPWRGPSLRIRVYPPLRSA